MQKQSMRKIQSVGKYKKAEEETKEKDRKRPMKRNLRPTVLLN